jgi:hypothetical protein
MILKEKRAPTTFTEWQSHFNMSIYQALANEDKSVTLRMLQSQHRLAANLGGKVTRKVSRRRKNFMDDYSYGMLKVEAHQNYTIAWYARHVKKLEDKMKTIGRGGV